MLEEFAIPEMKRLRHISKTIFQHDRAPCHWAKVVKEFLHKQFGHKWIGNNGPMHWAPRSPDLTTMDYHLWGHVKSLVTAKAPTNVDQLMSAISSSFEQITSNTLFSVFETFKRRLQLCMKEEGGHFEHLKL